MDDSKKQLQALLALFVVVASFSYIFKTSGCTLWDARPISEQKLETPLDPSQDPVQDNFTSTNLPAVISLKIADGNFQLQPVAKYQITGRVVSQQRYYVEWDINLSPLDLAIVWGELVDHKYDKFISYDHGNRFFHWRYKPGFPLKTDYVISHSSNNHLIPNSVYIENVLKSVKVDEIVELDGYLVNVEGVLKDGRKMFWHTSTVRTDTGGGACELIYVEKVKVGDKIYGY